ncbi:MAG TPA: hypothetical protein PLR99_23105 [Polyangiaceae bacterium]|nr:hypothetical protein [Polyangiaceae bacterium]
MSLFGRPREETLPRADVEMADADPRRSLRAEIEDDIELFALRLEGAFLSRARTTPGGGRAQLSPSVHAPKRRVGDQRPKWSFVDKPS